MKRIATQYGGAFSYTTRGYGPLFFKYDYGISNKIGIGLVIGYFYAGVTETYSYQKYLNNGSYENHTQSISRDAKSLSLGARFNYHFGDSKKSDPYIGFAAGYTRAFIANSFETTDRAVPKQAPYTEFQPLPLYIGITVGLRQYITNNAGLYFEIGFDKWSFIQAGLAFKLSK